MSDFTWSGNLDDDCTARWRGLTLRAEAMGKRTWWWCVYIDGVEGPAVAGPHEFENAVRPKTGVKARLAAERAAVVVDATIRALKESER